MIVKMSKILFFISWISITLLTSCGSVKDITYLQGEGLLREASVVDTFELKIQKDDLLDIQVSCANPELLIPFYQSNGNSVGYSNSSSSGSNSRGYLVEADGTIAFPLLGKIKVNGLTRRQVSDMIQQKLKKEGYIKDPIVIVRFLNFRISVLGEVARPGIYSITSEHITLFEAISMAGDLTVHGRRNRVAVVREVDGIRTILYHDLRSMDVFQSPNYYLKQNDMVYVEPNRVKAEASVHNQFTSVGTWISIISFITTLSLLIFK